MADPEIRWVESGASSLRAEFCQVQSTREETSLLFGTSQPRRPDGSEPPIRLERRIVVSPSVAKQLAAILASVAREHEALAADADATPAGHGATPVAARDVPPGAEALVQRVNALGVGYGFERSFKMGPGQLLDDRVILGIRTARVAPAALVDVCRSIGMPAAQLDLFSARLPEANTAGFGFEGGPGGGVYKVYLEFWDRLRQRVLDAPANVEPDLLFLGFKWDAADASKAAVARYTCHPLLSVHGILRRLAALYEGNPDHPSLRAAQEIVRLAASRIGKDSFVYVEAAEEGNPRKSFDLNLYKAGLRVADLQPVLEQLGSRYALDPKQFERVGREAAARPFGHLSGGLGRDGRDFLTVYYEIEGL